MPIKRTEYIKALSKDHHSGLLFCWKIKEGIKKGVTTDRLNSYMNYFWEGHLKSHFEEEEVLLFNPLKDDPLSIQALDEHVQLLAQINSLNTPGLHDTGEYLDFTQVLTDHIRFEERVLFPHLEQALSQEALVKIGEALHSAHEIPFEDTYKDEFWIGKPSGQPS